MRPDNQSWRCFSDLINVWHLKCKNSSKWSWGEGGRGEVVASLMTEQNNMLTKLDFYRGGKKVSFWLLNLMTTATKPSGKHMSSIPRLRPASIRLPLVFKKRKKTKTSPPVLWSLLCLVLLWFFTSFTTAQLKPFTSYPDSAETVTGHERVAAGPSAAPITQQLITPLCLDYFSVSQVKEMV